MQFIAAGGGDAPAIPKNMSVTAISSGFSLLFGVFADRNMEGIDEAEFRALYVPTTDRILPSVDLSGLVHDGVTEWVVTGIDAFQFGAQYKITLPNPGRMYFAWRLHNSEGWSEWSDGNLDDPVDVTDYVDTEIDSTEDTGAPSGWGVTLMEGPVANTVVPRVTRPTTNGDVIRSISFQVADGDTVTWRALDANAGQAATYYDGSAISHTLSNGGRRVTRDAGSGFGTAQVGDLACLDVTGAGFAIANCQNRVITSFEGGNAATATWFEVDTPFEPQSLFTLNVEIVKAPWMWDATDGYLGQEANRGYVFSDGLGGANVKGDLTTNVFYGPPIEIPSTVTNPEVRVFLENGYSVSDNTVTHSTGLSSGISVSPPQQFTDFSDTNLWVPVNDSPVTLTRTINADKSVTLEGILAGYNRAAFAGVLSRGIFFPDADTGSLEIQATFENCAEPYDLSIGGSWAIGIFLRTIGRWSTGTFPAGVFGGWGFLNSNAGSGAGNPRWESSYWSIPDNGFDQRLHGVEGTVGTPFSFTVRMLFTPRDIDGGHFFRIALDEIEVTGISGTFNCNYNAAAPAIATYGVQLDYLNIGGCQIGLGVVAPNGTIHGEATLTGFTMLQGRILRDTAGLELAQAQQVPSNNKKGLKIFKIFAK